MCKSNSLFTTRFILSFEEKQEKMWLNKLGSQKFERQDPGSRWKIWSHTFWRISCFKEGIFDSSWLSAQGSLISASAVSNRDDVSWWVQTSHRGHDYSDHGKRLNSAQIVILVVSNKHQVADLMLNSSLFSWVFWLCLCDFVLILKLLLRIHGYLFADDIKMCTGICLGGVPIVQKTNSTQQLQV